MYFSQWFRQKLLQGFHWSQRKFFERFAEMGIPWRIPLISPPETVGISPRIPSGILPWIPWKISRAMPFLRDSSVNYLFCGLVDWSTVLVIRCREFEPHLIHLVSFFFTLNTLNLSIELYSKILGFSVRFRHVSRLI